MKLQDTQQREFVIKLNPDYCGRCTICSSVCPFETISKDPKTNEIILDIEKCQTCGLCYSACPAGAINIIYYDTASLITYLKDAKREYDSDTLVIMCKGSAPDFGEVERICGVSGFIPLSVPCVGRIQGELFLKVISTLGIKKVYVLACDENYCRFGTGSTVTGRRIMLLNRLLEYIGYGKETIILRRNSFKVKADRVRCIRCGNCVFYCPYEAVRLEGIEAASFDLDLCRGCGLCVARCPAMALDLENWEEERISGQISRFSSEMEKPKILVFCCQWSVFASLDGELERNVRIIDLPCAGRVDSSHILEAFQKGVDGILVVACPEDDCRMERGSKEAQHLVTGLKKSLAQIGLEDRLHLSLVAPRYSESFDRELKQFKERLEARLS